MEAFSDRQNSRPALKETFKAIPLAREKYYIKIWIYTKEREMFEKVYIKVGK